MKWAVAQGYRQDNPAGEVLGQALGRQQASVRHMPALPHREVGAAIRRVHATATWPAVKLAFEFLVLTVARSGEVRAATWDEMDLDAAVWVLPAARTKSHREHRVPLSARAVAILQDDARQDVIEACLAHIVRDTTVAAYARSDLFERRRRLMDDWAAYLNNARSGHLDPSVTRGQTV